jgi:lipopolysaccharide/colanic/teichoic acid biosynthesis glycosyltransferase
MVDCAGAFLLLMAAAPCMALIAVAAKLSSSEPVLFRQRRVGLNGSEFELLKFRTMKCGPAGHSVTREGDTRITTLGSFLRKWKLDELPQLINVMRGEMSLVGPRPELPRYIAQLGPDYLRILSLRPGITGAASMKYRDEERVLAQAPAQALESFYVTRLLPDKAKTDWEYACSATLLSDLRVLLGTVCAL